ncbi:LOG family protein [Helicobacter mesocricetorum]|uniref:LOG family protein n=1 Tax=Helicobacter mesocricetorum TaxID=87012 RepID=UPI000CF10491|nr:TIGR00730 family Rossman fold protein [Helicobacter mesocricetorum]
MQELLNGYKEVCKSFEVLKPYENILTIFGGARVQRQSEAYQKIERLAFKLGREGYSIMTGGGPGIMEAANKGLVESKDKATKVVSIGLNIQLPYEQAMNPYVEIPLIFESFFSRKFVFNHHSIGIVVGQGGFGTLDELSEILTLIATQKMQKIPIILYGRDYWRNFLQWIEGVMLKEGLITKEELEIVSLVDSPEEVLRILKNRVIETIHH